MFTTHNDDAHLLSQRYLREGHTGPDVARLQQMLSELGYGPDEVDGIFGGMTTLSVLYFQREYGLDDDAVVGPNTVDALLSAYADCYGEEDEEDDDEEDDDDEEEYDEEEYDEEDVVDDYWLLSQRYLQQGHQGDDVFRLQELLWELDYDTNGVDGIFGGGTARAVVQFQRDYGLGVDGIVGPNTVDEIIGAYALLQEGEEGDEDEDEEEWS